MLEKGAPQKCGAMLPGAASLPKQQYHHAK